MSARARRSAAAARERASWPVRVYRLAAQPRDDLSATSTPEERLAMMEALARDAFALAGRRPPTYARAETPIVLRRLGE